MNLYLYIYRDFEQLHPMLNKSVVVVAEDPSSYVIVDVVVVVVWRFDDKEGN